MSYPFDPHYGVGRRSEGKPDRGGALASQQYGKAQNDQFVRPVVYGNAWRTMSVAGLEFNNSATLGNPGSSVSEGVIVWADADNHDKTFDLDLRDGMFKYVQPQISSIAVSGNVPFYLYLTMYYKTGAKIQYPVGYFPNVRFFSGGFNYLFEDEQVIQINVDPATQAWETVGEEAMSLCPSAFSIRGEFTFSNVNPEVTGSGSVNLPIDTLFITSYKPQS